VFDLSATLRDLATRNSGRSEADIQAGVRDVLIYGGFDLGDESVLLETSTVDRKRLDVTVGALIIECKRDLRGYLQLARAEIQIGGYLRAKYIAGGIYTGLLTDGVVWRLYRYTTNGLDFLDELILSPSRIDERRFRWWLGAVLSTEKSIQPNADTITAHFGSGTPAFKIIQSALMECWKGSANVPGIEVKRQLWARLLRSALGSQFENTDELFIEHTYLVLLATLIGHAVVGFDLNAERNQAGVLLSGQLFEQAGLLGVGQAGFFDWLLDTDAGPDIVSDIARRVASFKWAGVDHDVLKILYHSVIAPQVRKRLGEYYTPDWLAGLMVRSVISDPLNQRVLDPACGSGTFVFHAVREFLKAASAAEMSTAEAVKRVTTAVYGMDLHPVAVVLAQTTYLLAIGPDRLAQRTQTLSIPVYLGDSMRWEAADEDMYNAAGDIVLETGEGAALFSEIRFPASVIADAGHFDQLVTELVDRATNRISADPPSSIDGLLKRFDTPEIDRAELKSTFKILCDLHDAGRNHIWGYYIRNQSRPTWLSRAENRVDVLIGNPPWLAYRFMPGAMQKIYERRARERGLWQGGAKGRTTQQDLSAFFVARAVELYLRMGGRFGFVMPRAVLSRQTYGGFRTGDFSSNTEQRFVAFEPSWDLGQVEPDPFPVPSCVIFGSRTDHTRPLPSEVLAWTGRAADHGDKSAGLIATRSAVSAVTGEESSSAYKDRFRQGAILVPRMLVLVVPAPLSPLGVLAGRISVRSRKTTLDKAPWKDLRPHDGVVESIFQRPAYLGESVAPFRVLVAADAIIPYDGTLLMRGSDERIDRYPGLAAWWRGAEQIWLQNRSSEKRELIEQLDYIRQLSVQFPIKPIRVVYTKAGNTLAATIVDDHRAVIDHSLYWAPVATRDEGRYLTAILNSSVLTTFARPYQSLGAFGPRHFDKYIWRAPIPLFDARNPTHHELVQLASEAEGIAEGVKLNGNESFQVARRLIRDSLAKVGVSSAIDDAVTRLLAPIDAATNPSDT
jgi:N-6 DNA Methylase